MYFDSLLKRQRSVWRTYLLTHLTSLRNEFHKTEKTDRLLHFEGLGPVKVGTFIDGG